MDKEEKGLIDHLGNMMVASTMSRTFINHVGVEEHLHAHESLVTALKKLTDIYETVPVEHRRADKYPIVTTMEFVMDFMKETKEILEKKISEASTTVH